MQSNTALPDNLDLLQAREIISCVIRFARVRDFAPSSCQDNTYASACNYACESQLTAIAAFHYALQRPGLPIVGPYYA